MFVRIVLICFVLASMCLYPSMFSDGVDVFSYIGSAFLFTFQTISSIWIYKDIVGWDKFEQGLSLKRK